jgi:hypothetical protein
LKLQGKGQAILTESISWRFPQKIEVTWRRLAKSDTTHFPSYQELKENVNDLIDFAEFRKVISDISQEFHIRFRALIPWSLNFSFSITQWIFKLPSNHSIFKWSCVIFSRILFLIEKLISRRVLDPQASKFLPWNAVIIWNHLCLLSCIFHYEYNKIKDEKSPW